MSAPLNTPEFTHDVGGLYVGNMADDDGQIIDALFEQNNDGIEPPADVMTDNPQELPKKITRLLTGFIVMDTNYKDAVLILPPDPNRLQLRVEVQSLVAATVTDYVFYADEKGLCGSSSSYRFRSGKGHTLDDHTGAVWVLPNPGITGSIEVSWVAVTE